MKAWVLACLAATPAVAEDTDFVEANILGIFYHELGHAVIDIERIPVFAQEEDAADVFSILMIDAFWEADAAEALAWHASTGFWAEAAFRNTENGDIAWWDTHSPDERRFYNTVCLFYGAAPEAREDFAQDLGLPDERAETCEDEFALANDSWGPVIDEMVARGAGETFIFGGDGSLTGQLLADEVAALNAEMSLAAPLKITVESCGEANAFYDPQTVEIIMCLEFEDHLRGLTKLLD